MRPIPWGQMNDSSASRINGCCGVVGSALVRAALDDIRERHLKALVSCPYILGWMRKHPEYRELLFNAPPSKVRD
ncbi:GNAT family N-acetyltransferase [Nocardioides houyundeii]|uniref:GNAT family N-acetyltransferase n=1 Tax=Nocardioides houyundeii TaxID=2045452 RepID=UPI0013150A56|nr:GNAT family N-acetyltransferase [Nocardioides houyundeii]